MKKIKFTTNKSVDVVCKEIEQIIPCVLGTKPNKEKGIRKRFIMQQEYCDQCGQKLDWMF